MTINNYWCDLEWEGQKFYLPKYTSIFREVEYKLSSYLAGEGFQECLFPKLPTLSQKLDLQHNLPRLSKEWSTEIVNVDVSADYPNFPSEFTLAHWQCEPFYYFLKKEKPKGKIKFFDKSGWSYRAEAKINNFRLFEFQRIESVWYAQDSEALKIQYEIISGLNNILMDLGLKTQIVKKNREEEETQEKSVVDIEVDIKNYGKVELVGSHLHGRLFIDGLDIDGPDNFFSGCCGIGLNRIVNAMIELSLV